MATTDAEKLRKVDGGVIGNLTPKTVSLDVTGVATGDLDTGLVVPAGKFVLGAFIRNPKNDVTSDGSATLAVKVGSTAVVSATAIASVKNSGVAAIDASPDYSSSARSVYLTVATAALTAGNVEIGVIYV